MSLTVLSLTLPSRSSLHLCGTRPVVVTIIVRGAQSTKVTLGGGECTRHQSSRIGIIIGIAEQYRATVFALPKCAGSEPCNT